MTATAMPTAAPTTLSPELLKAASDPKNKIECRRCKKLCHAIRAHLLNDHEGDMTVEEYEAQYPGAPVMSAIARAEFDKKLAASKPAVAAPAPSVIADPSTKASGDVNLPLHEVFGLPAVGGAVSAKGKKPIPIAVLGDSPETADMVPDLDPNYVFNVEMLRSVMLAVEMRIPMFLWGHSGTGKTTLFEQVCARTRRPMLRVQHTINMEEEHIVGGWRLRGGQTVFELGPLALAMKLGLFYLADEYDFGRPEVLSVYQPVLEGKPLVIKEADQEHRVIRPHKNFRIGATGNTNGTGDESGLYQGTSIQNAANFERFGIVEQMPYMDKELETRLIAQQARIAIPMAAKLVDYATKIRDEFASSVISAPISPRSLIYAARIGTLRDNMREGLEKAYINRLSATEREIAGQTAQRHFT
jgi:cobaltochelatase CobS